MKSGFCAIAHRGFSSRAPENTFAAFDLALADGFANIELDVQLSSDKIPVIIHDRDLDRTTNGTGEVHNFSLNDLSALDAGSWFDAKYSGQHVPAWAEVLQRYAGKAHLHLEMKSEDPELPGIVAQTLKDQGWLNYASVEPFAVPGITITSFSRGQLAQARKLLPNVPHHWLREKLDKEAITKAVKEGLQGVCVAAQFADARLIDFAKTSGLTVRGLGVRSDEDIATLFAAGAEGSTTNWPDRVEAAIAAHKSRHH